MSDQQRVQYVEADKRTRFVFLLIVGIWLVAVFLCKRLADEKFAQARELAASPLSCSLVS